MIRYNFINTPAQLKSARERLNGLSARLEAFKPSGFFMVEVKATEVREAFDWQDTKRVLADNLAAGHAVLVVPLSEADRAALLGEGAVP